MEANSAINKSNYPLAYNYIERALDSKNIETREEAIQIARNNRTVIEAGEKSISIHLFEEAKTFSLADLSSPQSFAEASSRSTHLSDKIKKYKLLNPEYISERAFDEVYSLHSAEIIALVTKEQERRKQREANTSTGIVINSQILDESTTNTHTGALLGSAFGQAAYIDSTRWNNYSAKSQFGAGLAGAMIGSLTDKPSNKHYRIIYFIRLKNGDTRQVEQFSHEQKYIPPGVCVEFLEPYYVEIVNQNRCA